MSAPATHHTGVHNCFGCQKEIGPMQPHIHVRLDDFAAREGLPPTGLGDRFVVAVCEPCTERAEDGWKMEAHL